MNISKQLFRQPIRFVAITLLLCLGMSFFSLGVGVLYSAKATVDEIEKGFVTIGIPTTEKEVRQVQLESGGTIQIEQSVITEEIWHYLYQLAEEGSIIDGVYQRKFISAFSPSISSTTSASESGRYNSAMDAPYNAGVFYISVVSVGEPNILPDDSVAISLDASVEQVVTLHPDYTPRSRIRIAANFRSEDEFKRMNIIPGSHFLIYGTDYQDADLALRTALANNFRCPIDDINYKMISFEIPEEHLDGVVENAPDFHPVAIYEREDKAVLLSENMIDQIDLCTVTVSDMGNLSDNYYPPNIDGSQNDKPVSELFCRAYMSPIAEDVNTFLSTTEGAIWQEAITQLKTQYQCVVVFGTDLVESIFAFHQGMSFITQGRSFTDEEYASGKNVCILSETTAAQSGLAVGDTIDLSFYWAADPFSDLGDTIGSIKAQTYSEKVGFLENSKKTYEIVGIYRQSDFWEASNYNFTPNTILVPNASLTQTCYIGNPELSQTFSIKNGSIDMLETALASKGYPKDILICFDNGYTEMKNTLESFYSSSVHLFWVSCVVCVMALLVYLVLFVYKQKRTIGLMLSLGSGIRYTKNRMMGITIFPVIVSVTIGVIIGTLLMNMTLHKIFSYSQELFSTDFSSSSALGHATFDSAMVLLPYGSVVATLTMVILFGLLIYFSIGRMVKQSPEELIRAG